MSIANDIAVSHFGKRLIARLARRGIKIIGLTVIPDNSSNMPYANGETGYNIDDNGTGRVLTLLEVHAIDRVRAWADTNGHLCPDCVAEVITAWSE